MKNFIEFVLPLEEDCGVPDELPMTFETQSNLEIKHTEMNAMSLEQMRETAIEELDRRVEEGEM